jgi:hypothetical protein
MIHRGAHHWGVDHRGTGASGHGTPGQPIGDTANQSTPSGTQPIRFHPAHYRILSGTQPSQSGRKGAQEIIRDTANRDPSGVFDPSGSIWRSIIGDTADTAIGDTANRFALSIASIGDTASPSIALKELCPPRILVRFRRYRVGEQGLIAAP